MTPRKADFNIQYVNGEIISNYLRDLKEREKEQI